MEFHSAGGSAQSRGVQLKAQPSQTFSGVGASVSSSQCRVSTQNWNLGPGFEFAWEMNVRFGPARCHSQMTA